MKEAPHSLNTSDATEKTRIINLDKILKLDSCFRCRNPRNCTLKAIQYKFKTDPDVGEISKSTFHHYLKMFRDEFGAEFKGNEIGVQGEGTVALGNKLADGSRGKHKIYTFAHAKMGHTSYYQYRDINAPLPGLQKMIGKVRKDAGSVLLAALQKEAEDDMASSVHVWLRLFLEKMLNGQDASLQVVSFYDNLHLSKENLDKFETILRAILNKTPLKIHYVNKVGEHSDASILPYRLKNYNMRWFLIAKCWNPKPRPEYPDEYYEGYSNYPLDGIKDLVSNDGEVLVPAIQTWEHEYIDPDEEIDDYFNEMVGVSVTPEGPKDVYLSFTPERFAYVASKPLSPSQINKPITEDDTEHYRPGRVTIKLRAHLNRELEQQILSFGSDCEVVAPQELRDSLVQKVKSMTKLYSD